MIGSNNKEKIPHKPVYKSAESSQNDFNSNNGKTYKGKLKRDRRALRDFKRYFNEV